MSQLGQERRFDPLLAPSDLPPTPDTPLHRTKPRYVPILLQKSFWDDEKLFPGPLMRFVRGNVKGPHCFAQKRPPTIVLALRTVAGVEASYSVSARFLVSFDFRLLQQYLPKVDFGISAHRAWKSRANCFFCPRRYAALACVCVRLP
jgi:hypothetical protein